MATYESQVEHFGIDFGTTNIAIGGLIVDHDSKKAFRVLYSEDGVPFPSLLAIKDNGSQKPSVRFGRKVKTQVGMMQEEGFTVIKSIKTALGSETKYSIGALRLSPTQIVGALIAAIKKYLSEKISRKVEITSATVAVPVDFNNKQRLELMKAFDRVGIKVNKIVSESLAAYIRNREEVEAYSNVMVFDWGGGTLDISLLDVEKGKARELATSGWKVAGDKIDESVAEFVHNQLVNNPQYNIHTSFKDLDIKDRTKIINECEKAKITFSDEDEIDSPAIISMFDYCGEKKIFYKLSYDDFSEKIKPIVREAIGLIGGVLEKANKRLIDLNAIIMVGGSSNLLPLNEIMESEFSQKRNIKIVKPEKPQWSVAEGAAIIDSVDCRYELNQDISIVMSDGTLHPVIPRGSKIPYEGTPVSFGTVDGATGANFILADDKENIIADPVTLPAKGFLGEYFEVKGTIENSMIATISFSGSKMMGTGSRIVEINQLSYFCDISEIEDYKFEIRE